MNSVPNDQIDPYENRLSRRVGAFAEQAVVPIDASAVAAAVAVGAVRRGGMTGRLFGSTSAGARLALIGAGAVLAAAAAIAIGGGATGILPPTPTGNETTVAFRMCTPYDVDAVITAWDGAAGRRIATVELRHIGSTACSVQKVMQPWLAGGDGTPLIMGSSLAGARPVMVSMEPGDVLHTLVQVGNYCGPAPKAPVTVAFTQADVATFVATALTPTDLSGLPPCNGSAGPTDDIQMQPWQQGPATP